MRQQIGASMKHIQPNMHHIFINQAWNCCFQMAQFAKNTQKIWGKNLFNECKPQLKWIHVKATSTSLHDTQIFGANAMQIAVDSWSLFIARNSLLIAKMPASKCDYGKSSGKKMTAATMLMCSISIFYNDTLNYYFTRNIFKRFAGDGEQCT